MVPSSRPTNATQKRKKFKKLVMDDQSLETVSTRTRHDVRNPQKENQRQVKMVRGNTKYDAAFKQIEPEMATAAIWKTDAQLCKDKGVHRRF